MSVAVTVTPPAPAADGDKSPVPSGSKSVGVSPSGSTPASHPLFGAGDASSNSLSPAAAPTGLHVRAQSSMTPSSNSYSPAPSPAGFHHGRSVSTMSSASTDSTPAASPMAAGGAKRPSAFVTLPANDNNAFDVEEQDASIEVSESDLQKVELNLEKLGQRYPAPAKYEIFEEIGKGAFGKVHRARAVGTT